MNKFCVKKWDMNKDKLKEALMKCTDWDSLYYTDLIELCVKYILNPGEERPYHTTVECINYGDAYSGEMLFIIQKRYGGVNDCLLSYAGYGSCPLCDTLESIYSDNSSKEGIVKDLMYLCKDMVCNIVKPFNAGWCHDERFDTIEIDNSI